ncbi:MAG: hypothetical protein JXQ65_11450 [Candidatus Marinimicrobia bacterium]|nr:hypothetical protein [Candidatus Neomarinimicrobiota bacterium]
MKNKKTCMLLILAFSTLLFSQEVGEKTYSVGETRLTVLKSIVLPGWGEHSLGHHKRGYFFNSTELTGWLAYAAFTVYGKQTRNDMRTFAADHAGVSVAGKGNQYWTDIGNYMNIHEYNDQKARYRQMDLIYTQGDQFWAWDLKKNQKKFDDMRLNSRIAKRNASMVVSALVLNRLLSVIDIATLTKNKVENPYTDDLETYIFPEGDRLTLSLNYRF